MKRCLVWLLILLLLPLVALADEPENFTLTATVAAKSSALLALPIDGADVVLELESGAALTVTALGTSYCEAECGGQTGYISLNDLAFDVLAGEPTVLAVVDVSPTNQLFGRMSLREEASTKSKALRRMEKGCLVLIAGEENGMYRLAMPGYIGYGTKKNVSLEIEPVEYRIAYVDNGAAVHLRLDSRYGDNWIVMKLEPGTPVQYIRNPNGWAEVEVAGYRGRIVGRYLSFDPPEDK